MNNNKTTEEVTQGIVDEDKAKEEKVRKITIEIANSLAKVFFLLDFDIYEQKEILDHISKIMDKKTRDL